MIFIERFFSPAHMQFYHTSLKFSHIHAMIRHGRVSVKVNVTRCVSHTSTRQPARKVHLKSSGEWHRNSNCYHLELLQFRALNAFSPTIKSLVNGDNYFIVDENLCLLKHFFRFGNKWKSLSPLLDLELYIFQFPKKISRKPNNILLHVDPFF